jgi:hypothetical protein
MGSTLLDSFAARQEQEGYAALMDMEAENEDNNILTSSAYMSYATYRNSPISGR